MLFSLMVLDHEIRGRTEDTIDLTIEQIPYLIGIFRTEEFKKKYHIQNETDLTLGMVWGYLFRGFQDMFTVSYQRQPNQDEISEAVGLIFKRTDEIKEAIFKCG